LRAGDQIEIGRNIEKRCATRGGSTLRNQRWQFSSV
jgi:hypothetical protein